MRRDGEGSTSSCEFTLISVQVDLFASLVTLQSQLRLPKDSCTLITKLSPLSLIKPSEDDGPPSVETYYLATAPEAPEEEEEDEKLPHCWLPYQEAHASLKAREDKNLLLMAHRMIGYSLV